MNKILNKFIYDISPLFLIGVFLVLSFALSADEGTEVESVTIIGTKEDAKDLPGSGSVVSNEDLKKQM